MEFRRSMKDPKLGLHGIDTKEIDALFHSLDADRGGSLDTEELRAALKRLRKDAAGAAEREARAEEAAEHWRMRAKQTAGAIKATEALENAERKLLETRIMLGKDELPPSKAPAGAGGGATAEVSGAVDARLYAAMVRRNLKVTKCISAPCLSPTHASVPPCIGAPCPPMHQRRPCLSILCRRRFTLH